MTREAEVSLSECVRFIGLLERVAASAPFLLSLESIGTEIVMVNAYEILGLETTASEEQIRSAYRQKAHIYHPDKGGQVEHFVAIQKAYEILSNEKTREFIGRLPQFRRLPLRIQPSLSSATSQLFQNLNLLDEKIQTPAQKAEKK